MNQIKIISNGIGALTRVLLITPTGDEINIPICAVKWEFDVVKGDGSCKATFLAEGVELEADGLRVVGLESSPGPVQFTATGKKLGEEE